MCRQLAALVIAFMTPSALADADTLFYQAPDRLWGLPSDTEWTDSIGLTVSSLGADDFRLTSTETACALRTWIFFGANDVGPFVLDPPASQTVRLRFYADASGLPGGVIHEQTIDNPPLAWTGRTIALVPSRREYRMDIPISGCFTAQADTTYWVEIAQLGDPVSMFRWESARGSNQSHVEQYPIGNAWRTFNDYGFAFELLRTPEPGTVWMLGGGAVWLGRAMARRSRRLHA